MIDEQVHHEGTVGNRVQQIDSRRTENLLDFENPVIITSNGPEVSRTTESQPTTTIARNATTSAVRTTTCVDTRTTSTLGSQPTMTCRVPAGQAHRYLGNPIQSTQTGSEWRWSNWEHPTSMPQPQEEYFSEEQPQAVNRNFH